MWLKDSLGLSTVQQKVNCMLYCFRASWKTEPQSCGGNLRATTQPQTLTSPGYPQNYPGGLECLYTITAQPGRIITLEVSLITSALHNACMLVNVRV